MPTQTNSTPTQACRSKWGNALTDAGYTITPSVLIAHFVPATGLGSRHLHIIEYLNKCWWDASSLPRPAKTTMAEAVGIHPETVRRYVKQMEVLGLLQRVPRRSAIYKNTNMYVITDKLKKILEPFAEQEIQNRKTNKELKARQAKHHGKPTKVKLRIVNT